MPGVCVYMYSVVPVAQRRQPTRLSEGQNLSLSGLSLSLRLRRCATASATVPLLKPAAQRLSQPQGSVALWP